MARKKTYYRYTVEGWDSFPIDMLRYDCSFPAHPDAVSQMVYTQDALLRIKQRKSSKCFQVVLICDHREPTKERWASFGWMVTEVEKVVVA